MHSAKPMHRSRSTVTFMPPRPLILDPDLRDDHRYVGFDAGYARI
jgi:hypothetical protein